MNFTLQKSMDALCDKLTIRLDLNSGSKKYFPVVYIELVALMMVELRL